MADRIHELLAFDLAAMEAASVGRPLDGSGSGCELLLSHDCASGEPIRLVGFDEAGRGALAGPVAVACVQLDLSESHWQAIAAVLAGLDDSKRLSAKRRQILYQAITSAADWGFGCASALEIDRVGIVHACTLAAQRALGKLGERANVALMDRGLSLGEATKLSLPEIALTRGDARSLHIAAASVLAKVGRDAILERLGRAFPGYGLAKHKGYGTRAHREAIRQLGPSVVHRRSFHVRPEIPQSQSC